jgi:hypothetical protein
MFLAAEMPEAGVIAVALQALIALSMKVYFEYTKAGIPGYITTVLKAIVVLLIGVGAMLVSHILRLGVYAEEVHLGGVFVALELLFALSGFVGAAVILLISLKRVKRYYTEVDEEIDEFVTEYSQENYAVYLEHKLCPKCGNECSPYSEHCCDCNYSFEDELS